MLWIADHFSFEDVSTGCVIYCNETHENIWTLHSPHTHQQLLDTRACTEVNLSTILSPKERMYPGFAHADVPTDLALKCFQSSGWPCGHASILALRSHSIPTSGESFRWTRLASHRIPAASAVCTLVLPAFRIFADNACTKHSRR